VDFTRAAAGKETPRPELSQPPGILLTATTICNIVRSPRNQWAGLRACASRFTLRLVCCLRKANP